MPLHPVATHSRHRRTLALILGLSTPQEALAAPHQGRGVLNINPSQAQTGEELRLLGQCWTLQEEGPVFTNAAEQLNIILVGEVRLNVPPPHLPLLHEALSALPGGTYLPRRQVLRLKQRFALTQGPELELSLEQLREHQKRTLEAMSKQLTGVDIHVGATEPRPGPQLQITRRFP